MYKSISLAITAAFFLLFSAGCAVENNYLNPADFADYLKRDGVPTGAVRPLPGDPFQATSGAGIMVGNSEIGVYKFDPNSKQGSEHLERVRESERLYINGIPYPVVVVGSFVVFGLEKNTHKREIIRTFKKFY
ncbi:MAG: hypothetical protein PHI35_01960 [Victivallaceae bacterium]|nr:hypothetical protein [Victivallaceae bacterium]